MVARVRNANPPPPPPPRGLEISFTRRGRVINTRRADTGHDACRAAIVMLARIGPLEHGDTLRVSVVYDG